jgi:hypothetical protein
MSAKRVDAKNRWRNVMVSFRASPEEAQQLDRLVALSGLTKQDYIMKRLADREITVESNPRVYKALRIEMSRILQELQRISDSSEISDELKELIGMIATILGEMKGEV